MKRSLAALSALLLALSASACGGDDAEESGPVTLTLAGWSLATTPEFKTLADGFRAAHPDIAVELKEYDAANYDTQMIADLAAGKAPDIYVQKNLKNFYTYQNGKQLLDVSDVAGKLGSGVGGLSSYQVDGKTWAIPYRQDSWVLFYNKALFDKAGVKHPDGSWTWDDYGTVAKELTTKLKAAGDKALGTYQHTWQSTSQGFALGQTAGADLQSGDFGFLKPYYEKALALQAAGAQVSFGDATTNSLTYQAQFGKQSAAMMPMGTWYIATLLSQQAKGDADTFEWGIAPAPQATKSTTGTSATPVTFADPTGLGINPKISESRIEAAKSFLAYAASADAAKALAGIGVTPADTATAVDTIFTLKGAPTDDLSKFTFTTHDTKPENPVSKYTAPLQNVLKDLHTAVLSGSKPIDAAITEAQDRAKNEVLSK
ncbi:multiple sugar transport system substrate-binding protein [Actinoplanes campanulatus]|uniref:Multiple sugar transport system substrate-binding protein n=1 Tax=Actinoplanes campanulatus TaxID=113559 RepID=A0A7W5ASR2_9ACTN|nr:extracellular solute-binding protein [Actinoplanes campanulatus]MBB3101179.1 multiple sugar transport system substrate-binding protein [Actinoplanes campanulatus]GGN49861.1 sugar ABC transporter substrate-binding protein [Actinoplanes campanulatus]GID41926.1 sugar ABC transporter substrate-binding protein [Actinoplanes campanulatus]